MFQYFFIIFLHFLKGMFFSSYNLKKVWMMGIFIILLLMLEAFLGYVLVCSQMSFWACTVITSLIMIIPFFGMKILFWVWSNYYVSMLTMKMFFLLHFFLPMIMLFFIMFHLIFLHEYKSSSKIYFHGNIDKIMFFPLYWYKDLYNLLILFLFYVFILFKPYYFNDSEMFLEMNHLVSPIHIIPEWYFLFAYDILRSIPNKMLGVLMLLISILIYFLLINFNYKSNFNFMNKSIVFIFIFILFFLSYLGSCLVEYPFILMGLFMTLIYFKLVFLLKFLFY